MVFLHDIIEFIIINSLVFFFIHGVFLLDLLGLCSLCRFVNALGLCKGVILAHTRLVYSTGGGLLTLLSILLPDPFKFHVPMVLS
jgi:hypothetical protein